MTIHRSAPERLPRKALPLAVAALLLGSLPLLAGQESRPNDSSDVGRTFEAPSAPSVPDAPSVSSEPSAPSAPSEPSVSSEPSEPSVSSEPSEPSELTREPVLVSANRSRPSDSSDTGRTAHETGSRSSSSASSGSGSSGSGRTAHPTGPGGNEPNRQPPTRGSRGHDGRGFRGGVFYGYPGFYGPYGYWPSFSWWWGGWWGDPYYYPGYGYGRYGYGQPGYYGRGELGALDIDVSPGRTEVYIDGEYVGKATRFDGWPGYLWLPRGTYDVVFYLDGFKTIARQVTVYPGTVIDFDDRMEPGPSTRPEDLASKSHERRDSRLQYEQERRERIERGEPTDEDNWRDRMHRERGYDRDRDNPDMDREDQEEIETPADTQGKGRLRLEVEPEDASVYVDGRFVGTGAELGMMRGGLPLAPGEHRLAVVRPGHKAEERDFKVEAGADVKLDVELEAN